MTDNDIDEHIERIDWNHQQDNGEVLLSVAWEVFILGVSLLSVFNLVFVWFIHNPDLDMVVFIMDSILVVVFLIDLVRRMVVAESKRDYFVHGYGWLDFLAAFPLLRILRLFRIWRASRIMRRMGGPTRSLKAFFSNKAAGGLLLVLLIALLVLEFGALAVLSVERGAPDANIQTAQDTIWYVLVTMSTVGYGDKYPVTDLGRIIGSLIILVGVGVFGTLTGFLANAFLAPSEAAAVVVPPAAREDEADGSDVMVQDDAADSGDALAQT